MANTENIDFAYSLYVSPKVDLELVVDVWVNTISQTKSRRKLKLKILIGPPNGRPVLYFVVNLSTGYTANWVNVSFFLRKKKSSQDWKILPGNHKGTYGIKGWVNFLVKLCFCYFLYYYYNFFLILRRVNIWGHWRPELFTLHC